MKTYQDLIEANQSERSRMDFILNSIREHKQSDEYSVAENAKLYASGKNATIMRYQKMLYTLSGKAVPDNFSANHKCASGFFKRFVIQQSAYLLGNGVSFENEDTKDKLGKNFDSQMYSGAKNALIEGVSFGFFNKDHVEFYTLTEFVPLFDEENGALMAGIRFWQIDNNKPLRATLFELDGYTEFIKKKDKDMEILREKQSYIQDAKKSEAEGEIIYNFRNYPSFPIVPLWANPEKQSELVGKREQIDCYDLIKSGFANDLDDASMIYWTLENCGGMDDLDLAKFRERMKILGVANVDGDDGSKATAHTIDVPYQSRETYLARLEKDLYKDSMALDTEQIAAGNITATQIEAAYEPLNEKTDEFELCVHEFINGILQIAGIEDVATFKRSQIVNRSEETTMILLAAEHLDDETLIKKLPFLSDDEAQTVLERKKGEELGRFDDGNIETDDQNYLTDFSDDVISQLEKLISEE